MATEMKEYSLREVAQHKTKDDLWMVVHGKVVNATHYFQDHPGGAEVMLETAGTDASEAFDDAGHSEDAFEIMEPYVIGTLRGATPKKASTSTPAIISDAPLPVKKAVVDIQKKAAATNFSSSSSSKALVAVVVIGGVLGAASYGYSSRDISKYIHTLTPKTLARPLCKLFASSRKHQHVADAHAQGRFGFLGGFLTASATMATISALAFRRLAALADVGGGGFEKYPRAVKAGKPLRQDLISRRGFLEPGNYKYLPLTEKTEIAPDVYKFRFDLPTPTTVLGLPVGQHVAIRAEIEGKTVSRSYTPVSNNEDLGRLELIVRCYPDGQLTGRYLAKLQVGDEVAFRGPKGAMRYTRSGKLARRIAMVAGGTGITPMYQLIRAVCEDERDTTQISLVYANRGEGDVLLRAELDAFARRYPAQFRVWYMLDKAPQGWQYGEGYVNAQVMRDHLPAPDADTKLLLCGPPPMVNACKKTAESLGFKLGGAVPKMTDQVFVF
ncbi:hypothetical protein F5Y17DRAFT_457125 [Xylariaceae sp. FL0594]|nr:hypothetical protein F5Y17DRAFT_457125 [Xylariaceae sp. FL0594]